MSLRPYIPGKPTLLLFFATALRRLRTRSAGANALTRLRIASATEEVNQISDDIGNAEGTLTAPDAIPSPPGPPGDATLSAAASNVAREQIHTHARLLETLLDNLPYGVSAHSVRPDDTGGYLLWNEANEVLFGVKREQALGKSAAEVMSPEVATQITEWDRQLIESPMVQDFVTTEEVSGRGRRILRRIRVPIFAPNGQVEYLLVLADDITDAQKLADSMRLASKVFETTADGIVMSDADDRVISVNAAFSRLTGLRPEDIVGQLLLDSPFRPDDLVAYELRQEHLVRDGFVSAEVTRTHKNGTELSLWMTKTRVCNDSGIVVNYVRVFSDISSLKQTQRMLEQEMQGHVLAAERVQYLAQYDNLTSLPNRSLFSKLLNEAISKARHDGAQLAVLIVNLDRFKNINDALGHATGDLLLKRVAKRFQGCLRAGDTVGRMGGDEFVVLLPNIDAAEVAAAVARKILHTTTKSYEAVGQEFHVTASIGISTFPKDGDDDQSLMQNADIAMYRAKEEGKNNLQFYSAAMSRNSFERLALESSLRRALERGDFQLHYQPKINLRSGQIAGLEALLRWVHPELGMVAPAKFIALAEETGLIVAIGKWVLQTACRQLAAWQNQGLLHISMAINLSPRQFQDANLLQDIKSVLADTGVSAGLLELEITESMLMHDLDKAMLILTDLRAMGVRIAIDDFGTGYSSFSNLKRFPIDTIKVDRSFIRGLPTSAENRGITEAILAMGKALNLNVIAEGVETKEQADYLRTRGCNEFQGFYFSKAVPASEAATILGVQLTAPARRLVCVDGN